MLNLSGSESVKSLSKTNKPEKASIKKDIVMLLISAVVFFSISSCFDFFEKFISFSRKYEKYEVDEIMMLMVILAFCFMIFSVRRIFDLKKQIRIRIVAENQINERLKEKEILLREINHRVKNNFQMITSILSLQKYSLTDEKLISLFEISENRIRTISHVYDILNQSENMASIQFDVFLKILANEYYSFKGMSGHDLDIIIDAESIELNLNQSIPCGLIVNELITNSIKHAFTSESIACPVIRIDMKQVDDDIHFGIIDNGSGMKESDNDSNSLGFQLIKALIRQLKGNISWESTNGTSCRFTFPRE